MWGSTNRKDKDQAEEPHQNIQDKGKDESSNPISHEDCHPIWLDDGIFFCLIGPKNFHPKINWKANHFQFSLALERWRGHWLEGRISKLPLDKGNKLKERSWRLTKGGRNILCGGREKEKKECVRKRLVLMCGKVLFMKKMCARNKHGRISMTKPLEFYFK